jgi:hypothetical protein
MNEFHDLWFENEGIQTHTSLEQVNSSIYLFSLVIHVTMITKIPVVYV